MITLSIASNISAIFLTVLLIVYLMISELCDFYGDVCNLDDEQLNEFTHIFEKKNNA